MEIKMSRIKVGDYFTVDNIDNCSSLSGQVKEGRMYLCTKTKSSTYPAGDYDPYIYFIDDYGRTAYHYANMFTKVTGSYFLDTIAPTFRDTFNRVCVSSGRFPEPAISKTTAPTKGAITSDGGSTAYYELVVAGHKIETHNIISDVFDNDFDMGNMFKAQVRIQAAINGNGKAGTSIEYDLNKIIYTCIKLKDRHVKTT